MACSISRWPCTQYFRLAKKYTDIMTQQYPCENCKFRAHYDKNPKSVLGRFWRWHINFCPGWKNYFTHQDDETKAALRGKYNFEKYK